MGRERELPETPLIVWFSILKAPHAYYIVVFRQNKAPGIRRAQTDLH